MYETRKTANVNRQRRKTKREKKKEDEVTNAIVGRNKTRIPVNLFKRHW